LIPAIEMKAKFNVSTISWSELEPQATRYKTARIADEFNLATAASMKAALIIRTVDSHIAHRPADLQGLEWDHPAVVLRFTTAVTNLLGKLQVQPEWLHLAYEVEPYFDAHPQELPAFKRFLTEVKAELKKVSNASIGIVFGFDATKAHNQAFQELESICDHIAFDYYALRSQAGFSHVSAENPSFDIPLMLHFAGDRKVLLTEAGYASSHAVNGSNEKQKVFFERLFQEIAASKGQIAAVNVWSMNDMPIDIVQQVIDGYSLEVPGVVPFLSSLGIRTSNGTPKPAYSTLMNHFNALHETCSTQ
jgi:hypothetical protein